MTNITLDQHVMPGAEAEPSKPEAKAKKATKNAKPAKKAKAAKPTAQRAPEQSNKKSEVITMMKGSKGATLAGIMEATGWQKHTVRGFVSILGSKGAHTIESSKNAGGGAHI